MYIQYDPTWDRRFLRRKDIMHDDPMGPVRPVRLIGNKSQPDSDSSCKPVRPDGVLKCLSESREDKPQQTSPSL